MSHDLPSARSQRASAWISVGVVLLAALLGAGVLAAFLVPALLFGETLPVRDDDKAALVTASHLEADLAGAALETTVEQFEKRRRPDGAVVLSYDYEHPGADLVLHVRSQVIVFPRQEQAQAEYGPLTDQARRLLAAQSPQASLEAQGTGEGDWSKSALIYLSEEGIFRGGAFVGRHENRTFVMVIYCDRLFDAGSLPDTSLALEALLAYEP